VPPDGADQYPTLDLAPESRQVLDGVTVGYVGDVLVDDGPGGRDRPRRRPEERVVDVDDPILRDQQVVEGDAVVFGARSKIRVVGDDERYLRLKLSRVPAPDEIAILLGVSV
jgi:hypothetical protein